MRSQKKILPPSPQPLPLPSAVAFSSWILVDKDSSHQESPCLEILKALGMHPQVFHLSLSSLWSWLPSSLWRLGFFRSQEEGPLGPPWPDFVLGTGRLGAPASSLIKRLSPQRTFAACLHKPKIPLQAFDAVISTAQDPVLGKNVMESIGGFSSLTPERLKEAAHAWWGKINFLPQPWIGVFITPSSSKALFSKKGLERLAGSLVRLTQKTGGSLLVSCLPHIDSEHADYLKLLLGPCPHLLRNGEGESSHEAFLGIADYLLGPVDCPPLLSDMLATDKPLYLYPTSNAPACLDFAKSLYEKGLARPFKEELHFWSRAPFVETQRVANNLLALLQARL